LFKYFIVCILQLLFLLLMLPTYDPILNMPPAPPPPSLTIAPNGTLYLTKPLMTALGLEAGAAINLVPPVYGDKYWHLDLRDTAPCKIDWSGSTSTAVRGQSPRVRGIKLPPGLVVEPLRLFLLPLERRHPKYIPLLPANAFAS
jgi:hypothetical protein